MLSYSVISLKPRGWSVSRKQLESKAEWTQARPCRGQRAQEGRDSSPACGGAGRPQAFLPLPPMPAEAAPFPSLPTHSWGTQAGTWAEGTGASPCPTCCDARVGTQALSPAQLCSLLRWGGRACGVLGPSLRCTGFSCRFLAVLVASRSGQRALRAPPRHCGAGPADECPCLGWLRAHCVAQACLRVCCKEGGGALTICL